MDESFVLCTEPVKWTVGAIQCYKRGCNCKGCDIYIKYPSLRHRCSMKYCVKQLIKTNGLPDDIRLDEIIMEDTDE